MMTRKDVEGFLDDMLKRFPKADPFVTRVYLDADGPCVVYRFGAGNSAREPCSTYLVPENWDPSWRHFVGQYEPWFLEDLERVADSVGRTKEEIIEDLISDDPNARASAYRDIGGYWGWNNFDDYSLRMSEEEFEERWSDPPRGGGTPNQPVWKTLWKTDLEMLQVDETGRYPPELEVAQELWDEEEVEVFRVTLEPYKLVRRGTQPGFVGAIRLNDERDRWGWHHVYGRNLPGTRLEAPEAQYFDSWDAMLDTLVFLSDALEARVKPQRKLKARLLR